MGGFCSGQSLTATPADELRTRRRESPVVATNSSAGGCPAGTGPPAGAPPMRRANVRRGGAEHRIPIIADMAARGKASGQVQRTVDGAWVRSRTAAPTSEGDDRLARLLAEAGWIVGAVAAVALFAMLATFSSNDPAFSHTASAAGVANIGGRFGAWVADIVMLLFGISAYLLVFGLAITVCADFASCIVLPAAIH